MAFSVQKFKNFAMNVTQTSFVLGETIMLLQVSFSINKEVVIVGRGVGFRMDSLVVPDDFTVLTGDMKLEHVPTLHVLDELKRNLQRK